MMRHSTFINCPAQKVWEATTDIDSWPDWAPTVQTARRLDRRRFGIGSQASIKQPMQPRTIWIVTAFEDGRHFAWETSGKALRMRATHRVTPLDGGARCTLEFELIGPAARFLGVFLVPFIWGALVLENRGLKRWCERNRQPGAAEKDDTLHQPSSATTRNTVSATPKQG